MRIEQSERTQVQCSRSGQMMMINNNDEKLKTKKKKKKTTPNNPLQSKRSWSVARMIKKQGPSSQPVYSLFFFNCSFCDCTASRLLPLLLPLSPIPANDRSLLSITLSRLKHNPAKAIHSINTKIRVQ